MKNGKIYFLLLFCICLICHGCGAQTADTKVTTVKGQDEAAVSLQKDSNDNSTYEIESPDEILLVVPEYTDETYVVLNENQPDFTLEEMENETAFEQYSELDRLGRCGVAYANVCPEIMPTEERGAIGQVKPTGWHLVKYGIVDGNYLYNRCHLIAYQLAGENANEKNLITGTRYFNVSGMLPFENIVADYVKETGHHVLYRVTPVYDGENLVAAGVEMEAYSVEDDGEGVCFHVFVYNSQPGIEIDYATGESRLMGEGAQTLSEKEETSSVEVQIDSYEENPDVQVYILNTNTKKFHAPDCASVKDMKEKNKKEFTGSREDVVMDGYEPCQKCKP